MSFWKPLSYTSFQNCTAESQPESLCVMRVTSKTCVYAAVWAIAWIHTAVFDFQAIELLEWEYEAHKALYRIELSQRGLSVEEREAHRKTSKHASLGCRQGKFGNDHYACVPGKELHLACETQ